MPGRSSGTAGVAPSPVVKHAGLPADTRHASAGSVASLGLYQGVAQVYGVRMRGFPAWLTHRTYHLLKLPTVNRRLRVASDWTLALLYLDVLEHPREDRPRCARVPADRGGGQA